jgi:DNA polymerase-1
MPTAKSATTSKAKPAAKAGPVEENLTPKLEKGDHVFLVDGSGYIFRAYHALPPLNRKSDGLQVNAVLGFCNMLWKLLADMKDDRPTHLAVIFDKSEKTFRTDFYPDYKAHRPDAPADLIPQFPLIREAVRAFDIPCLEQAGFEADDLIATYARLATEAGARTSIVSSDKDLMQLVSPSVTMYDTMKDKRIGREEVIEKFGVPPEKVIEVQSLIGDSTDNVPGVSGVGPKAASTLISEFGSLEEIYKLKDSPEKLDDRLQKTLDKLQSELDRLAGGQVKLGSGTQIAEILKSKFGIDDLPKDKKGAPTASSEKIEELAVAGNKFCEAILRARSISRTIGSTVRKVIDGEESALVSKRLVTLDPNVPLDVPVEDLAVHQPDYRNLVAFLKAMEFSTLTRRIAEAAEIDASQVEPDARLVSGAAANSIPPLQEPASGRAQARPGWEGGDAPAAPGGVAADEAPTRTASPSTLPLSGGGMKNDRKAGGSDRAEQGSSPTPVSLAAARLEKLRAIPFDRSKYEVVRSLDRLKHWAARAIDVGYVAVDTETNSLDPVQAMLCGFSLAVAPNEACYVPLAHRKGGGEGLFDAGLEDNQIPEKDALEVMKPVLEDRGVLKIGQNFKFDQQIFAQRGISVAPYDDTMLMSYVLDAGRSDHGMDPLAIRYFNHKTIDYNAVTGSGKSRITFDCVEVNKAAEYAAEDADVTLRLWHVLKPRLVAERMTNVYETLERPMVSVLTAMEGRGISIDRATLARLSGEFAKEAASLEEDIQKLAGAPLNPGSPKQLGDILFGQLGLPGGTKTKTGQWSTGAKTLEDLAEQGHKLPQKILDWRQVSKLRSTYTDALPNYVNPKTQRVHTSYALAATTTGRLSSSEPNLQNIPIRTEEGRKIRRAFIAAPGHKLVSADYSQIELRLLAEVANVPALRTAFQDGVDIHAMTASEMFGVPVKDMPGEVRRRAKAINFGIIYGISAFGLANQLGIEREEAGAYIKKYFERFPGIRDYMDETREFCRTNGYVTTLFGRKCHYPDIRHSNPSLRAFNERAAINARLQGSAADIIRRAMVRMEGALAEARLSAQMLLQVHDELIFEVKDSEVEKTLPIVRRVMEDAPHPAVQLHVPLQVEARAADNWDEAH